MLPIVESPSRLANNALEVIHSVLQFVEVEEVGGKVTAHPVEVLFAIIVLFLLGLLIVKTVDLTYIVFLVVYGVDTVLTICHRILLHEHLGEAHRKHAYQQMANELGMEHTAVSTLYSVLQLAICVGMILIPNTPVWHWIYFIGACVVLGVAYLLFMKKYYHLHAEYLRSLES